MRKGPNGVQSTAWSCTEWPRATPTCPRRRCVLSSSTPLWLHQPHHGAASQVHHLWQSSILGRWPITNLEFSSRWRHFRRVAANLPKKVIWLCRSFRRFCYWHSTPPYWTSLATLIILWLIDYRPRSRGDNTFGSVRPSVCLWALSCLNRLTSNLDFWQKDRPWPWLAWGCRSRS